MASDSESEVYADNLSEITSDVDVAEVDSEYDSDEEVFYPTHKVLQIVFSDSEESDCEEADWSEIDTPPIIEQFLGESGVVEMPNNPQSVHDAVQLFIGDDLFDYMVLETNRYHRQNVDKFKNTGKRVKWKDVTMAELKKMMGLILLMGIVRKENMDDYWSTDRTIETPIFAQVMSRDRFRQIWYSWHFCNNKTDDDDTDRLKKIQHVVSYFSTKFESVYKPQRELSLEESVIPWRGRLSFRVYNPSKITKYGLLVRTVCEAKTGYICKFKIYHDVSRLEEAALLELLHPFANLRHHVYTNNYYNSVSTSEMLLQHGFRSCGTIRKNRGLPACLKNADLKKGQSIFRRQKDVLVQCWGSKRQVRMISTIHSSTLIKSHSVECGTKTKTWKPVCVADYNKYMKDVDRAEKYPSYGSIVRRTKKWTKRTVMFLINSALFNAFKVFKTLNSTSKKTYKMFLHDVAKYWIGCNVVEDREGPQPSASPPEPEGLMDFKKHKLSRIVTGGVKKNPQRQCRVCSAKKIRSLTCFMCEFCKVSLHKGDCFFKFHTSRHYYS